MVLVAKEEVQIVAWPATWLVAPVIDYLTQGTYHDRE